MADSAEPQPQPDEPPLAEVTDTGTDPEPPLTRGDDAAAATGPAPETGPGQETSPAQEAESGAGEAASGLDEEAPSGRDEEAPPGPDGDAAAGSDDPGSGVLSDIELVTDASEPPHDEAGQDGADQDDKAEEDEWDDWGEPPGQEPGPSIAVPELEVTWPAGLAPSLVDAVGRDKGPACDRLVAELPALWGLVAQAAEQVGLGCLTDGSVRWGGDCWQLAPFPRAWRDDPVVAGPWNTADPHFRRTAWLQDRQALAGALVDAVTARRPVDVADALALIDEAAGEVAEGLDAVLHLLLGQDLAPGDVGPLYALHGVLARESGGPVAYRCFRETLVGSAKATGHVEDNEDVASWLPDQRGSVALALLDGITGAGDGAGYAAARVAMRTARELWTRGETEPLAVLRGAEERVMKDGLDGGAAAVFARLEADGRGRLASVGDSAAWLLRPHTADRAAPFAAWRLTPVHTERADRRLDQAAAVLFYDDPACFAGGESVYDWLVTYRGRDLAAVIDEVDASAVKARIDVPGGDPWRVRVPWQATPHAHQRRFVDLTDHYRRGEPVTIRLRQVVRAPGGQARTEAEIIDGAGLVMRPRARSRVEINPESLRLGLLHEHGPGVVAIAVFDPRRTGARSSLLSGAGWVLVEPADLPRLAPRLRRLGPQVRRMIAGVPSAALTEALGETAAEVVLPSSSAAPPQVSQRPATELPFISDPALEEFRRLSPEGTGRSFSRRTFAAGWAYAWAHQGKELTRLTRQIERYADLFAANTELLVRVVTFIGRPGHRSIDANQIEANLERAAPLLGSIPAQGTFRKDLISALLGTTYEDLYQVVTRRLLPVASRLADVYDPELPLGGRRMDENLYDQAGVRRLGLFGRLATALPEHPAAELTGVVSALDDELVIALADIPAPSLQYLVAKLRSPEMLGKLRSLISQPDLDLLNRYNPAAWRLLLEGLYQPEHLGPLGLGWALVVGRAPAGSVDARALVRLASQTGHEPSYIVRALLDTPVESWAAVCARPVLAQHWLTEFGTLDFAAVLSRYADAERLVERAGPRPLRAAAAAGLDRDGLEHVLAFAASTGVAAEQLINAITVTETDLAELPKLTGPAAAGWISSRLSEGDNLGDIILDLLDDPGQLRTWAVDGDYISSRVLADVLGVRQRDLRELGLAADEGRDLVQLLADSPGLIRLSQEVIFPRQRLALLRLAARRTDRSLVHRSVLDALPGLIGEPDPAAVLDQILDEQLTRAQVIRARALGLDRVGRQVLFAMGPLSEQLPAEDVATLVGFGLAEGPGFAADAAQLESRQPGTVRLLSRWGARWLPMLAGPDGRQIATLLRRYVPEDPAFVTSWLLAAGHNGLRALARHGDRLLSLVGETRPPVADVLLIDELLEYGPPHASLYTLVVTYGLPRETWREAASMLAHGEQADDVLLRLWDSSSARLLRASG